MKIIDKFKRWWYSSAGSRSIGGYHCKVWMYKGKYHRDKGPAIIYSYGKYVYYQYGVIHRTDGPAIVEERYYPLSPIIEFWYKGKKIECKNTEEFKKKIRLLAFI